MTEEKERLAILGYLIKKLPEIATNQIGTTTVQKLMYLLNRTGVLDYRYTMYHYGPYSGQLSDDQNRAAQIGLITVNWIDKKGYDIKFNTEKESFIDSNLSMEKKTSVDGVISRFGRFNANELSLIATAYFVLDKGGVNSDDQLIEIVSAIKPDYRNIVSGVLKRAGVIPIIKTS